MVKIIGTGKMLEKGREYEVPEAMAKIIVEAGRATFEREVEEIVHPKEKVIIEEAKEKVQVTHTEKA